MIFWVKMALDMIQFLFLTIIKKLWRSKNKKIKIDHRYIAFKKLKKKIKIL